MQLEYSHTVMVKLNQPLLHDMVKEKVSKALFDDVDLRLWHEVFRTINLEVKLHVYDEGDR